MTPKTEFLKLSNKCVLGSFDRCRIFTFVFAFLNDKLAKVINRNRVFFCCFFPVKNHSRR